MRKILPLISDGKLLNENLAKLECLGGKKKTIERNFRKRVRHSSYCTRSHEKRDRRSSSNMSKTRAMKIASHTEFKVIYFGTLPKILLLRYLHFYGRVYKKQKR